jgi:hypothetical protein
VIAYVVSMYAAHQRCPPDCLPEFYLSRKLVVAAGEAEVARVAAIPSAKRKHTIDWAVRFTAREVKLP